MKNGINNKQNKAVTQIDLKGVFIDKFHSISEAARQTGIPDSNISRCCNKKLKTAGGFKWKYNLLKQNCE